MRHETGQFVLRTAGAGFTDISVRIARWLESIEASSGVVHLFIQHTSASLTIQENADPRVLADLVDALSGLAPVRGDYRHNTEGPDDMPAHIKAMLTSTDLTIPVRSGQMALGTWQGVYLIEHRTHPHERSVLLTYQGT